MQFLSGSIMVILVRDYNILLKKELHWLLQNANQAVPYLNLEKPTLGLPTELVGYCSNI